jgi:hypothetical protein
VTRNKKPSTEPDKSQVEHALGEQVYLEFATGLVGSKRRDEAEIGAFFSPNKCDVLERVPVNGFVHTRFHGVGVRVKEKGMRGSQTSKTTVEEEETSDVLQIKPV